MQGKNCRSRKWITATESTGSQTKEAAVDLQLRSPSDDSGPPLQNLKTGRPFRLHRAYATMRGE